VTATKVVAFGGGHGLSASLRALRSAHDLDLEITAVVTVADDGGSSGRLRAQRDALPPGDLRQALAALAGRDPVNQLTAELFQHRFEAGPGERRVTGGADDRGCAPVADAAIELPTDPLSGHAVGNLVLCGLMELLGDPVAALDHVARMIGVTGRVLPMSCEPLGIEADVRGADAGRPGEVVTIRGQHAVAVTPGLVETVRLTPKGPPACPQAVEAVAAADWLIFGPGSWYTSVIPHLLVPELASAIVASPGRRLVMLNLAAEKETLGLSVADHLAALSWYLPELHVDTVLADGKAVGDPEPVARAAESLGARLVLAPVAVADGSPRHDFEALGAALVPVLGADR
jgi:uncharacterized cofD-like protein